LRDLVLDIMKAIRHGITHLVPLYVPQKVGLLDTVFDIKIMHC
jgi:hypothetical protein